MATIAPSLDPQRVAQLQPRAGNSAVAALVQRAPAAHAQNKHAPKLRTLDEQLNPAMLSDTASLDYAETDFVPRLLSGMNGSRFKHFEGSTYSHGADAEESTWVGAVSVAKLFAQDVIYNFSGNGRLLEVESNLSGPIDPANPDVLPPPRFPLPDEGIVLVVEPANNRKWQAFRQNSGRLEMLPYRGDISVPEGMATGELAVFMYAPHHNSVEDGGKPAGWKAKKESGDAQLQWATTQYERLLASLGTKKAGAADDEPKGTGHGRTGTGIGGGGSDLLGVGTGTSGTGTGADPTTVGGGSRGRRSTGQHDRAKPDKVVLYAGKRGPMLNVWVGTSVEAIPLKDGEDPESLRQRVEEAAARQRSTGKRLADGATDTGFEAGHGGGKPTKEELEEATSTEATSMAYPSKIDMQGGSGAEVSPQGWATTVTGARHDFDMTLDRNAITFGLVNQVAAAAEQYSFYWQVVDVSNMGALGASTEDVRKKTHEAAKDQDRVRHVSGMEGVRSGIYKTAEVAAEEIEADRPPPQTPWDAKAPVLAVQGVSATWDIAKSIVVELLSKAFEPENRRKINFGNSGEFVVRCLANPPRGPHGELRATSIAAFPVRVVDVDERAIEANVKEKRDLATISQQLAATRAKLDQDPDNERLKSAVEDLEYELAKQEKQASETTTERLAGQEASIDDEIGALEKMIVNVQAQPRRDRFFGLVGREHSAGLQIEKRLGLYADYEWENRLADLKKARAKKHDQLTQAKEWSDLIESGTEVRPKVTFSSEENGALVHMEMILGRGRPLFGMRDGPARWLLMDVTSDGTKEKYTGSSSADGPAGNAAAIVDAFQEFADKAAYGRGVIAVDLPDVKEAGGKVGVARTIPMKPGSFLRWKKRLDNLMEVAMLLAPVAEGGAALARAAEIGMMVSAGYRMYERVSNDRSVLNFEAIGDVMALLGPVLHGVGSLAELLKETKTGYVLQGVVKGASVGQGFFMTAQIVHDIDAVLIDGEMGAPEKKAAISLILGKAVRDGSFGNIAESFTSIGGHGEHEGGNRLPHDETAPAKRVSTEEPVIETAKRPDLKEHPTKPVDVEKQPGKPEVERQSRPEDEGNAKPVQNTGVIEETASPEHPSKSRPPVRETGPRIAPSSDGPPQPKPKRLLDDPARTTKLINGDPAELKSLAAQGEWTQTMNQLKGGTDFAEGTPSLAREAIMDELLAHRSRMVEHLKEFGGEPVSTASAEPISDVDVNFKGPGAGQNLIDAERFMVDRYGEHWRENYRMAFMVDANRLVAFEAAPVTAEMRTELALRAETLRAARELRDSPAATHDAMLDKLPSGIDRGEVERLSKLDEATRLAERDRALLAADAAADRMQRATQQIQRATKAHDQEGRKKAEAERDAAARELTLEQMLANAMEGEAYIDPAAAKSFVLGGGTKALSGPTEYYGAVREQMNMITHLVHDTPGGLAEAVHRYELLKYINRTVEVLEAAGYTDAQLTFLTNWSELGYRVDRQATSRDRGANRVAGDLTEKSSTAGVRYTDVDEGSSMGPRDQISGDEQQQLTQFVRGNYQMFLDVSAKYLADLQQKAFPATPARSSDASTASTHALSTSAPTVGTAGSVKTAATVATASTAGTAPSSSSSSGGSSSGESASDRSVPEPDTWMGRRAHEDVPLSPGGPSMAVGRGRTFEPQPKGKYRAVGEPSAGISESVIVEDENGNRFLFKPLGGEKPVPYAEARGVSAGHYAERAKAAEISAEELGVDTPAVTLVEINGRKGSLTAWREGTQSLGDYAKDNARAFLDLQKTVEYQTALANVHALDYLINNLDRVQNLNNYLIEFTHEGRFKALIPIDQELSFTTTQERAIVPLKTSELPYIMSKELADNIKALHDNPQPFIDRIMPLVGEKAIPGVVHRLNELYQRAVELHPV